MNVYSLLRPFPKPILYDAWENDKYTFKFSRIGGDGYLSVSRKETGAFIAHTICPDLKVARAEAEFYWI
jgi:hypothetical protein